MAAAACAVVTVAGTIAALLAARAAQRSAYAAAKALASAGFVGVAVATLPPDRAWVPFVLAALCVAAAADVALAVPSSTGLQAGMAGFAVAHGLFVAGFALRAGIAWLAPGAVGALVAATLVRRWLAGRLGERMLRAVAAYAALAAMTAWMGAAAGWTARVWQVAAGAALVVGSDVAVAEERFRGGGFAAKAAGLPAYYAGQLLIAFSLAAL